MISLFDDHHLEFLRLLFKYNVEYLLIGGFAVNLHGYSRGTGDLDIWIGTSEENKQKLILAIEEFGYESSEYQKIDINEITMFSLGSRSEPGHIEITNRIAGLKFYEAYERLQIKTLGDLSIKYIHFKDLIINKLASARPRDLDDVENLKRIQRSKNEC